MDSPADLERFAAFDGFARWAEMVTFWGVDAFTGWHIRWAPLLGGFG